MVQGALYLGQWLEEKYGKDSMALLIDEGSGIEDFFGQVSDSFDRTAASADRSPSLRPLSARRGTSTLRSGWRPSEDTAPSRVSCSRAMSGELKLTTAEHTGIGLISLLIAELEKNPHEPYLNPDSPLVTMISCAADYAPETPNKLKRAIRKVEKSLAPTSHGKSKVDKKALKEVEDWWVKGSVEDGALMPGMGKAMVSTTQAVDIINGGVKVNALVRKVCVPQTSTTLTSSPRSSLPWSITGFLSLNQSASCSNTCRRSWAPSRPSTTSLWKLSARTSSSKTAWAARRRTRARRRAR